MHCLRRGSHPPLPYLRPPSPGGEGTRSGGLRGQAFGYLLPAGEGAAQRRMRGGAGPRPVPPLTRPSARPRKRGSPRSRRERAKSLLPPAGRRCRAAADEGGQRLGQYHPSPGLRLGSCEVGPDSPIGRQPFISLFFLLPARRVTGGKTTSTIRISPFLPQSRPNACPQRNQTGSPETTSKTLSIATSHQPRVADRWRN